MADWIHDHEVDTSEEVIRELLSQQCPDLAGLPLSYLRNTGTSNTLWRIHRAPEVDYVARLPRTEGAEQSIRHEIEFLPAIAKTPLAELVEVPALVHGGQPTDSFPLHWMIARWVDGEDIWDARATLQQSAASLAVDLADAVRCIGTLEDLPAPDRMPGERGGPLRPLLDRLSRWTDDPQWSAADLIDVAAVRRCAAVSAEVADEPLPRSFVHGDLIPGNLLLDQSRLSAIIDWGGAGYGDPAQDLAPAWAVFEPAEREIFRTELGVDDATWLRARAIELEHAVGGVLYYVPRRHPLGDVMARTLDRILTETRR